MGRKSNREELVLGATRSGIGSGYHNILWLGEFGLCPVLGMLYAAYNAAQWAQVDA